MKSVPFRLSKLIVLAVVVAVAVPLAGQQGYQKPPKEVLDVLHAPDLPNVNVNPAGDKLLLIESVRYPSIADLAQPMLRLAGLRINPATNGPHRGQRITKLTLKRTSDGRETPVKLPTDPYISSVSWSPDGRHFAFLHTTPTGIQLWIASSETGAARQIPGVVINGVVTGGGFGGGGACRWMSDSKTLACRTVPTGRGKPPERAAVPTGPNVQENAGRAAPAPTFQDLLQDAYDQDLFDYYATAQLALIDVASGKATSVGKPAIFGALDPAPDGQHILVARIHRPYSYTVTANAFPREVEVWNRAGKVIYKVASLPLAENTPLGGVPLGPRSIDWHPVDPATLTWVEALDEGNPRKQVPNRDKVMWIKAPFTAAPAELLRTEQRFGGLSWGERGDLAMVRDFDRRTLRARTWFFDPRNPAEKRLVWDLSTQDRYRNPGTPMSRDLPNGQSAMQQHENHIFLRGQGASDEGDRPFLDRFDTKTLKAERIFQSDGSSYETVDSILNDDGTKLLTRRESLTDPPNYFIRTAGSDVKTALTNFTDTTPQLRQIKKELVRYKRADGVDLSFTLYLPPDYKPGERRPAVVWAYPREFTDPDLAGQVSGSPNRFVRFTGPSHLFFLLQGFVVLDDATMPVVGDPETVNNTYVEQVVSSAKAAVDKAAEMGVIDPDRVGVGGHSYGAFMTANLLAHSDIFRAGIARSGAYNRTLTPFGFQSERRTFWEATEMYIKVSPFSFANRIKEPILLIHGEADNNTGTFPIQSERMYQALKGNGGIVRYVTLPYEAHGYAAKESVEHTLWEMLTWFEKNVKNAPPRSSGQRAASEQK